MAEEHPQDVLQDALPPILQVASNRRLEIKKGGSGRWIWTKAEQFQHYGSVQASHPLASMLRLYSPPIKTRKNWVKRFVGIVMFIPVYIFLWCSLQGPRSLWSTRQYFVAENIPLLGEGVTFTIKKAKYFLSDIL